MRIHLYSKKLQNAGQIFTYSEVSFLFHRGKIVFCSGLHFMYCLSHQLAVKFYLKWKHSQVFALPSPMGNHKNNPCLQQECPPAPSGHPKPVRACRGGQRDPEFVFSLSPSCASAAFGRRGSSMLSLCLHQSHPAVHSTSVPKPASFGEVTQAVVTQRYLQEHLTIKQGVGRCF